MPYNDPAIEEVPSPPKLSFPQVGIMTTGKHINHGIPSGKKARIFRELTSHAHAKGIILFFFYPEDVDLKKRRITGFTPTGTRSWVRSIYPFPDIVYNRVMYRGIEKQQLVSHILQQFINDNRVKLFNTRYLDKWEVYQALSKSENHPINMPESALFTKESLRKFINKYDEVFLKPRSGSKGVGIVKVVKSHNGFLYARAEGKNRTWRYVKSSEALFPHLMALKVRPGHYLIQEGIDMARDDDRVFDIRCQVQKNGQGEWVFTGAGIRIAARNHFVTHIPNGGQAASYKDTMYKVFGWNKEEFTMFDNYLKTTLIYAAQTLEKELNLQLGILSLDVAVNKAGQIAILEINSKPASFDEDEIRSQHFQYLTDYFLYMSINKN